MAVTRASSSVASSTSDRLMRWRTSTVIGLFREEQRLLRDNGADAPCVHHFRIAEVKL